MLACPTGSIGTRGSNQARDVRHDFPLRIEGEVYYCGFNSPKSYGGNSYFIEHPAGNWLIDSPKFLPHLAKAFAARGGVANIFLTHRDDVADAARYAAEFGSRRIIHRQELASQPGAEWVLDGDQPIELAAGFPGNSHAGSHRRPLRAAVSWSISVYRRPLVVESRPVAGWGPRRTTAGIPGSSKLIRCGGSSGSASSGSCLVMVSGFSCPRSKCKLREGVGGTYSCRLNCLRAKCGRPK